MLKNPYSDMTEDQSMNSVRAEYKKNRRSCVLHSKSNISNNIFVQILGLIPPMTRKKFVLQFIVHWRETKIHDDQN